jgi:hypothetical protein
MISLYLFSQYEKGHTIHKRIKHSMSVFETLLVESKAFGLERQNN